MSDAFGPGDHPGGRHVFKRWHPHQVTQILTLYCWRMNDQRAIQVDHYVSPRLSYYSSNTTRVGDVTALTASWQIERHEQEQSPVTLFFVGACVEGLGTRLQ